MAEWRLFRGWSSEALRTRIDRLPRTRNIDVPDEGPVGSHGWVDAGNITRFYRRWLAERVDVLAPEALDQLSVALRAALDL